VPAYQVLADALRARILTGELKPGAKLPIEPELSNQYGVSRSTVREALRVLASQNLITTTRGVSGGSFVAYPNPAQISGYLEASLRLLSQADNLSIGELAEARDMLEVPAAGLAAVRRSDGQLEELRGTLFEPAETSPDRAMELNKLFHAVLMRSTGSQLVEVLIRPVFEVIYDHVVDFDAPPNFWSDMDGDHDAIFAAVAAKDPESAQAATREHLRKLRPACR
jgi:GntR family transcriptional regulator, transcriptional repressor for pyruvate dehydrogenase complex